MKEFLLEQGDYLLRVLVAGICGLIIGYERESRMKLAGVRTHTIIAMAAALMVVISKYGFFDVIQYDSVSVDASRIAAGVVTGISFLGAGIILNRKSNISGITTSAGVWATLGIGMSIGAGMWVLGIGSTVMLLVIQCLFHRNLRIFYANNTGKIILHTQKGEDVQQKLADGLAARNIQTVSAQLKVENGDGIQVCLTVVFPKEFTTQDALALMEDYPAISAIDF